MKLAFLYGPFSLGNRPVDYANPYTSKRGLTGSELSCFEFAQAMSQRGHDVAVFCPGGGSPWNGTGVRTVPIRELTRIDAEYDVAYSWNEPDLLRHAHSRIRMVNQQLNDFSYCRTGWERFVDVLTSPSQVHLDYLRGLVDMSGIRTVVLPNGCDPSQYDGATKRVSGRVIYASSPDRGLHLLLEAWPNIRKRVPWAHLRVFYEMGPWLQTFLHQENFVINGEMETGLVETGYRARYIARSLELLRSEGVEAVGSVSRREMAREMSEAECLAYPCDTIRFTEGFSVSTLEGCASGAVPIVSACDALGSIYGELPTMVPAPIRDHGSRFIDQIELVLQDDVYRAEAQRIGRSIAERHRWDVLAERLEGIINDSGT